MIPNYPLTKTTWTDRTNGVQNVMAADVNQLYAETIAVENALTSINTLITSFYVSTDTSANDMIERAIASAPTNTNLLLPAGTYKIIRPIVIPDGTSFTGVGGATVLQPNFASGVWQQTYVNGTLQYDYRVFIVRGGDNANGVGYQAYNCNFANRIIGDFSISALNGSTVNATGLYAGTDQIIPWGQAINYAIQDTMFRNIYIEKLDTAYHFKECDDSNAIGMNAMYCRHGVDIIGKMINFNLLCNCQNFSMANTTVSNPMVGITVDQFTYSDIAARPEGIFLLPGCLVYGADNDLIVNNVLQISIANCMFDGANNETVIVNLPDGFYMSGCYCCTKATYASGISCISFLNNQTSSYSKNYFANNELVGSASGGGFQAITANVRFNLDIIGNDIQGFGTIATDYIIYLNNTHGMRILNNHGHNNVGIFVYNQTEGDGIIDGNNSEDNYPIVMLHPQTSQYCYVGKNYAQKWGTSSLITYSATYARGNVVLVGGQTIVTITPFINLGNSGLQNVYPLVKFNVLNDTVPTRTITYSVNSSNVITFTSSSSITATIMYEVIAMSQTAN